MKLLTKQPSYFSFINLIFKVHNLLPKLYKPTTCELFSTSIFKLLYQAKIPLSMSLATSTSSPFPSATILDTSPLSL